MAEVWPFAGTRFAQTNDKIKLADTICPPYDEIDSPVQEELHDKSQYNMVRLIKGVETPSDDDLNNRYTRASECYRDWKSRHLLSDEQRKCFYIYEQTFKSPIDGKKVRRLGFFALVKLQDFRSGKTRAFEMTYDSPKIDRLKLLRNTQINDSPLFLLYKDPEQEVNKVLEEMIGKKGPIEDFESEDGIHHRLWMIHKKDPILNIHEAMKPKRLFIAHGHHRYETALKYRDEQRDVTSKRDGRQPWDFSLMYLQRAEDETLFTRPIHRLLARELSLEMSIDEVLEELEEYFDISEFKVDMKSDSKAEKTIQSKIKQTKTHRVRMAMVLPNGRGYGLTLKKDADVHEIIEEEMMSEQLKNMDVVLLHNYVIPRGWIGNPEVVLDEDDIFYNKSIPDSLELLRKRKSCVGFFLNSSTKEEALEVAENGELLPHKSVDFFPKIPSGLVIRDLNVGFG